MSAPYINGRDNTERVDGRTYSKFMELVDQHIADQLGGLTSEDLPDVCDTYSAFLDGYTPEEAAEMILEEAAEGGE